jgi:hypothetical protein
VKFHDDITQRNLGLMARLKNTEKFENVWFYNCNVYAKPEGKSRIRYDLFDNIDDNELSPIYEYKFSCLINYFFISYFQVKIQLERKKKESKLLNFCCY